MTDQELTYNLNQILRRCASSFHSIHESRLDILALIKEAGYKSPEEVALGKEEVRNAFRLPHRGK